MFLSFLYLDKLGLDLAYGRFSVFVSSITTCCSITKRYWCNLVPCCVRMKFRVPCSPLGTFFVSYCTQDL